MFLAESVLGKPKFLNQDSRKTYFLKQAPDGYDSIIAQVRMHISSMQQRHWGASHIY
jgi:hypothetical protein